MVGNSLTVVLIEDPLDDLPELFLACGLQRTSCASAKTSSRKRLNLVSAFRSILNGDESTLLEWCGGF